MDSQPTPTERELIAHLLGRAPQGDFRIAARNASGEPTVIRNAPLLHDGTPMPTLYWLVDPEETRRIGRLESLGGVDAAEAAIDPSEVAAAHVRYAAERDAALPPDHSGPRPTGGVAGTRVGVKCLHAHWAWHLAGGDDPVATWIERRLATLIAEVGLDSTTLTTPQLDRVTFGWGTDNLTRRWLVDDDPPHPAALTNAIGTITDHLDDVERDHPGVLAAAFHELSGPAITALARVEVGGEVTPPRVDLDRSAAEEIFRIVATESTADRAHNPGLPFDYVESIVGACCVVVAMMRRWQLDSVTLMPEPNRRNHR